MLLCTDSSVLLFWYQKGHAACHIYLTSPVKHNNANGVDRQQYEKGRSGKSRNMTELSQVPTASCNFIVIKWQKWFGLVFFLHIQVILIWPFSKANLIQYLASML